jgi:hypothetical protein
VVDLLPALSGNRGMAGGDEFANPNSSFPQPLRFPRSSAGQFYACIEVAENTRDFGLEKISKKDVAPKTPWVYLT